MGIFAVSAAKARGGGEFGAGEGGGVGDDGEHVFAEGLMGGVGEVGGVGAAGVGDEEGAEIFESGLEEGGFLGQIHLLRWQDRTALVACGVIR